MGSMRAAHAIRGTRGGYTLIELLLVVGLLGLAGAIIVPSLQNEDQLDAQAAVRKLIGDLSFAQSDALAHQEYRRVYFFDDGSGYCIVRETQDTYDDPFDAATADYVSDPLAGPGAVGRYIIDFGQDARFQNVRITDISFADDSRDIVYDPLGGTIEGIDAPAGTGVITLSAGENEFQITVSGFTGKLSVAQTGP